MTTISIVIPSYNRAPILLHTIEYLLAQSSPAEELIVVDQTSYALSDINKSKLTTLDKEGKIIWRHLEKPSIPAAMNQGLLLATSEFVLFLDDDIRVHDDFLAKHRKALESHDYLAQVGQVLQPGEQPTAPDPEYRPGDGIKRDFSFQFNSNQSAEINNCMAGNLCVHRATAIAVGGFDENFIGAAYRFESEFCRRFIRASKRPFRFTPDPMIYHLKLDTGGTRANANHLTSGSAVHSMGDYYYALIEGRGWDRLTYCLQRFVGSVWAKFYLRKPWYIPVRLLGELRGLWAAIKCLRRGPRRLDP